MSSDIVPIFEVVNVSSFIKEKYFEKKGLESNNHLYRFHVSFIFHNGMFWITSIIGNITENISPVIIPETFLEEEKNLARRHLKNILDMPEVPDWHYLWNSDGKKMALEQFTELRNLWLQTLPQASQTNS